MMKESELAGHLVLVMAPSGSGKSALMAHLREALPELHFAVSCTTRDPRPGERDGDVYYFLTPEEFQKRIDAGELLEWAQYGGNRYGTLKSEILEPMRKGKVVVREVELQGVQSILKLIPEHARSVLYVDGGSWETLRARITARAPISESELALRYERYVKETAAKHIADIVVENFDGKLEDAKKEIVEILSAIAAKTKARH